jgi:hypothetical protein
MNPKHPPSSGVVLWRGPSQFDQTPIVVILTYRSKNKKTGNILQVYILPDKDSPLYNLASNGGQSVCHECPLRPKPWGCGACYVQVNRDPQHVWKAFQAGRYDDGFEALNARLPKLPDTVRVGAYGDPLAVPDVVWLRLKIRFRVMLGYTHAWYTTHTTLRYWRATCHSQPDITIARRMGWKVFVVTSSAAALRHRPHHLIPCSTVTNPGTTCVECGRCNTFSTCHNPERIAIPVHGPFNKIKAYRRMAAERGWI